MSESERYLEKLPPPGEFQEAMIGEWPPLTETPGKQSVVAEMMRAHLRDRMEPVLRPWLYTEFHAWPTRRLLDDRRRD